MVAEATNRQDMPQLLVVKFPAPTLHGPACGACAGGGLSDEQVLVPVDWDDQGRRCALVVDVLCPACGGCGHAEHELCAPEAHAGEPDGDEQNQDDYELAACASCGGRGWNPVPTAAGAVLRVPCGCTEDHTHRIDLDMMTAPSAAASPLGDG